MPYDPVRDLTLSQSHPPLPARPVTEHQPSPPPPPKRRRFDPVHDEDGPSSASSSPVMMHAPPPPACTLYQPRRITQPGSVLIPITPEEAERLRNSSQNPLRRFRPGPTVGQKRHADDVDDHNRLPHPSQRGDASLVAKHYNDRPEIGKAARTQSPIFGLKSFNNWIKSVLIAKFAGPIIRGANAQAPPGPRGGRKRVARVLDIGCGKGGDLQKWTKANTGSYVGIDIADISISQARERYAQMGRNKLDAQFFAMDCYANLLETRLPPELLAPFDVVTMQFCMHYAFESEEKVRTMLQNVSSHLRSGGIFIGTIPNAAALLKRLKRIPEGEELSFGNNVYRIRFETRTPPNVSADSSYSPSHPSSTPPPPSATPSIYGHKYWFYLKDAVDAPEYIVKWSPFVKLALDDYGLELVYKEDFHTIFEREREVEEFQRLLGVMKVVDAEGESSLDADQWEAANIYVGFAFRKR